MEDTRAQLLWIGLSEDKVKDTIKNEALTKLLLELITPLRKNSDVLDRGVGKLVYLAATTTKAQIRQHLPLVIEYVASKKIDSEAKLTAATEFLLANPTSVDIQQFEQSAGVGVTITQQQIVDAVKAQIEKNRSELLEKRYRFYVGSILVEVRKALKFADGKTIKSEVDAQVLALLGPKNESDTAKPKKEPKDSNKENSKKAAAAAKEEECKDIVELLKRINFHSVGDNYKTDGYVITPLTMKLLAEHVRATGGKVFTRFPPEPNGILHIGHAKAININFGYAQANGGHCYLRYDDTNPEKEEERFVVGIKDMVEWLGYKPYKVTYSSDYFDELYAFAVNLIKKDLAYVCHQRPEELKGFNPPPSPYRNRPIEESLALFDAMKSGKLAEGEATLRMKITLEEGKQDPVAYRIKMAPHHRTGNKWCIYPTYDFTHCLVDSLENITHSLCTKEFQSRRSAYYWLCNSLEVYCPVQWEYSRLNVNYTVVSKRKIAKLITERIVDDWDDPRLFTLTALRRRGFPSQAINNFCALMGLTVASAVVDPLMLEASVRDVLNVSAPRAMAVLYPVRVLITNMAGQITPTYLEIPDFPSDPTSAKHMVPLEKEIFIERDDFREDSSDGNFRRLTPKQMVGLRHAGCAIELKTIHRNAAGEVECLEVIRHPIESLTEKPKAFIHWVSVPLSVEVRLYERLFNHKNPEDPNEVPGGFLTDCNRDSKTILTNALVDISVKYAQPFQQFQFERVGFFSVDTDSRIGKLVFNRTVSLKESAGKN